MRQIKIACILAGFFVVGCPDMATSSLNKNTTPFVQNNQLVVGALLPLSGDLGSLGASQKAAIELAEEDLKAELAKLSPPIDLKVVYQDTQTNPKVALESLKKMAIEQGIRVFVGPPDSASVTAVLAFVDLHGLMLVSQSSTAPFLATQENNLYRMAPNDLNQARALATEMADKKKISIFAMNRRDAYGEGVRAALDEELQTVGKKVKYYVDYEAGSTEFSQQMIDLEAEVAKASSKGTETVAVQLTSFDETVTIFKHAAQHPNLKKVQWYGSDANAQNPAVLEDKEAAAFAADPNVRFLAPAFSVAKSDEAVFNKFAERVIKKGIKYVTIYTGTSYDSLLFAVQATVKVRDEIDDAKWRDAADAIAPTLTGVTGNLAVDDNGDRKTATYAFWKVQKIGDEYEWIIDHKSTDESVAHAGQQEAAFDTVGHGKPANSDQDR